MEPSGSPTLNVRYPVPVCLLYMIHAHWISGSSRSLSGRTLEEVLFDPPVLSVTRHHGMACFY